MQSYLEELDFTMQHTGRLFIHDIGRVSKGSGNESSDKSS